MFQSMDSVVIVTDHDRIDVAAIVEHARSSSTPATRRKDSTTTASSDSDPDQQLQLGDRYTRGMARVLVTGAAGFVGTNLVRSLLGDGHSVVGLDDLSTGRRENVEPIVGDDAFEFIEASVTDADTVRRLLSDVDHVLHQAAIPSVPRSVEDPLRTIEANCVGTATLLEAARVEDVESVVVASSSSVYGSGGGLPKTEELAVGPESPYALSKYFTESLGTQYSALQGLDVVALRYFNVFGPRQNPNSEYAAVIPKFISLMLAGERPVIYGDGEQTRDFTYIDNVVEANVLAMESGSSGEVFNVACGERTSVNELVELLNEVLGTDLAPRYEPPRPGDVKHSYADISKARDELQYEPTVGLREGLVRTVEHFR